MGKNILTLILDTDTIVAERFLRSSTSYALLRGAKHADVRIVIPEVVLDEVLGLYRMQLSRSMDAYKRSGKQLRRYMPFEAQPFDLDEQYELYKNWLFEQIREFNIVVVKYPASTLKEMVKQSCSSSKLFDDNPDGHNDYLIWKSIVSQFGGPSQAPVALDIPQQREVLFVTTNKRVFCQHTEGYWSLADELRAQIGKAEHEFDIVFSLRDVFAERIAPALAGEVVEEIDVLYYIQSKFDRDLNRIVGEELKNYHAKGFEGVPLEQVIVKRLCSVDADEVDWIKLSEQELHVTCEGTLEIEIEGRLNHSELWSVDMQEDDIFIIDLKTEGGGAKAGCNLVTEFYFSATFVRQQSKLARYELSLLEEMLPENYA